MLDGFTSTSPSRLQYALVDEWEDLPSELHHGDVAGVGVDSNDRVLPPHPQRGTSSRLLKRGRIPGRLGRGRLLGPAARAHCGARRDLVLCRRQPRGGVPVHGLWPITADNASAAWFRYWLRREPVASIVRSGPPFNKPTNLAVAPNGELYVSDGYGNARVHRFSSSGRLVQSWGGPGCGRGEFHLVHGIAVAADGTVFVADRENDRVQLFSPEGDYPSEWTDVQRPTNVAFDAEGRVFISELWRRPGHESFALVPRRRTIQGG